MENSESIEMYLETIYILSQRLDMVRKVDVSRHMGYAKPSVTRGIGLLTGEGFVTVDGSGNIILTEKGKSEGRRIYERHIVLTKLFVSFGVDEEIAAADACRVEHYISGTTFTAIKNYVEKQSMC